MVIYHPSHPLLLTLPLTYTSCIISDSTNFTSGWILNKQSPSIILFTLQDTLLLQVIEFIAFVPIRRAKLEEESSSYLLKLIESRGCYRLIQFTLFP